MVAAERDGIVRDFADFGNSPYNFTEDKVKGKVIVYSTTNGTNTINIASKSHLVLIGAYLNISALSDFLISQQRDVVILCAGWKDRFNLEDSVFAGALAEKLISSGRFATICDSTLGSLDLWSIAKKDLVEYTNKVAQKSRLQKNGLDDVIEYCLTSDLTTIIPVLKENNIITIDRLK
jgi:2-phosphosulfolactate phosphatase